MKHNIFILPLLIALFLGATTKANTEGRLYLKNLNTQANETHTLSFLLENTQLYYGFQADIVLSKGIEVIMSDNDEIDWSLSARADTSYVMLSNTLADGTIRIGAFSTVNSPIKDSKGELFKLKIKTSDDFDGGTITIKNIRFADANYQDVSLNSFTANIGAFYATHVSILPAGSITLHIGETQSLKAQVYPTDVADQNVLWGTKDQNVATIDENGLLTAVGLGRTNITATHADGPSDSIGVNVLGIPVENITLNYTTVSLKSMDSIQLSANVTPQTATEQGIIWSSSNEKVAIVNSNGIVTAIGIGRATITATATDGSGTKATCNVTVNATPIESISISANGSTILNVTETVRLTTSVLPENATNKSIIWSSSNTEVATIDANGLVTAIGPGTATISAVATDGSEVKTSCIITVRAIPIESITIYANETTTIRIADTLQLSTTILPINATNKQITWSSSNTEIATVNNNGLVIAINPGTATIRATATNNPEVIDSCIIIVQEKTSINWLQEFEMAVGEEATLQATASNGYPVSFRSIVPNGGYTKPELETDGNTWTARFTNAGAVILEAYIEDESAKCKPVRKVFNVLEDHDVMPMDGIYYRYDDAGKTSLKVTRGYRQYEGDIIVPAEANGMPVKAVDSRAFYSCSELASVVLPEGIERIENEQAFGNCPALTSVVLPSTLSYLGNYTFNSCSNLKEIYCKMKTPLSVTENIFNGFVDYETCILHVPYGCSEAYRNAAVWGNFKQIVEESGLPVPIKAVVLNKKTLSLTTTEKEQLIATILPDDADNKSVIWSSNDTLIANVNTSGEVIAVSPGTAWIIVRAQANANIADSCQVIVNPIFIPATDLNLDKNAISLHIGEKQILSALISPENASNSSIVWSSTDSKIATIDSTGLVTATGEGSTIIIAQTSDGTNISDTCFVTVKTDTISINWPQEFEMAVGEEATLQATASDGYPVSFRSIVPNGGYTKPELETDGNTWTARFTNAGAVILEAYIEDESAKCKPVRKVFNVLEDHDVMPMDGIYYRYADAGKTSLKVTRGYRQYEGDIIVPAEANGMPVKAVDSRAFYSCSELASVVLPEGIERIENEQAFGNCPALTSVVLPSTLSYLGNYTFNSCSNLKEIYCRMQTPLSVTENIFNGFVDYETCILHVPYGCSEAYRNAAVWGNFKQIVEDSYIPIKASSILLDKTTLNLSPGDSITLFVTILPENTDNKSAKWISSNPQIATVDNTGKVTAISPGTAYIIAMTSDGTNLTDSCKVTIVKYDFCIDKLYYKILSETEHTVEITYNKGNDYSGDIIIPSTVSWNGKTYTVVSIGEEAFARCEISTISIPGTIKTIGKFALGSSALHSVQLSEGVETIGYQAFAWCSNLTQIELPNSLRTIEYGAFASTGLTEIDIPYGVIEIGDFAFYQCHNLLQASIAESVEIIGEKAFLCCDAMTSFTLNNSIARIGKSAFANWESMKEIHCTANIPITIEDSIFLESTNSYPGINYSTCILYVPDNTAESYQKTAGWKNFIHIIEQQQSSTTPVSSLILNKEQLTLYIGEEAILQAIVSPEGATNKAIMWSSTNELIATVEETGTITAIGEGTAMIIAKTSDGTDISDTCFVTVKTDTISINWPQEFEMAVGEEATLQATASNGYPVSFRSIVPNGGYTKPELETDGNTWTARFTNAGAVILEAYIEDESAKYKPIRKVFNVLEDHDVMPVDGIYYRYADAGKTSLKVTRGYRQYEGNMTIPAEANGMPVKAVDSRAFYSCSELVSVVLPEGIERIENEQAFGNCPTLTSVVLPSTLSYLGYYALNASSNLKEIYCRMQTPLSVSEDIFNGFVDYETCVLHVPYGCSEAYHNAAVWGNFKQIVEESPILVNHIEFENDSLSLAVGDSITLHVVILPHEATHKELLWSSTNEQVVTIDGNGQITAAGPGKATVYATTTDGTNLFATCEINVELPVGMKPMPASGRFSIETKDGQISLKGITQKDFVCVYDINGKVISTGHKDLNNISTGLYLIRINNAVFKIAVP